MGIILLIKSIKTKKELNYLFCGLLSSAVFSLSSSWCSLHIIIWYNSTFMRLDKKSIRAFIYYIIGIVPMVIIMLFYVFIVRQETLFEFFGNWSNRVSIEQSSFMSSQMSNLSTFSEHTHWV